MHMYIHLFTVLLLHMYMYMYIYMYIHVHVLVIIKFISIISHCLQIPLPESVTGRYAHSLTAVTMSPHCVWLVIVGGYEEFVLKDIGGGVAKPMDRLITDTNRVTMIIELGKIIIIKIRIITNFKKIIIIMSLFQYILKLVSG